MRATIRGWQDNAADPSVAARLAVENYGADLGLDLAQQTRENELQIPYTQSDLTQANGIFRIDPERISGRCTRPTPPRESPTSGSFAHYRHQRARCRVPGKVDHLMLRDLRLLPKAHLHLHLEGAMRPATLAELAAEADVPTPPIRGYTSFAEFGLQYRAASALIETETHLRRVVREVVDDAADDGAVWVEPHFYPPRYAGHLGTAEEVLEIVIDEGTARRRRPRHRVRLDHLGLT